MRRVEEIWQDQRGATAVEYALTLGAIAAAVIGAVGALGRSVLGLFERVQFP